MAVAKLPKPRHATSDEEEAPSLSEIQRMVAGRLPQWSELEGKADRLLKAKL